LWTKSWLASCGLIDKLWTKSWLASCGLID
jgi:hypothetical protein